MTTIDISNSECETISQINASTAFESSAQNPTENIKQYYDLHKVNYTQSFYNKHILSSFVKNMILIKIDLTTEEKSLNTVTFYTKPLRMGKP